jgi:glycoside/pentoside/hexuronide:cation symporter, GPH family
VINGDHKKQLNNIPFLNKIGYGVNDMGIGTIFQAISTYLVFYATSILLLPGSLVGLAISISAVWDGLTDPVMGYLSDRTKTRRFGRRHPFILVGSLGAAITNYLLWTIHPELSQAARFVYLLLIVVILKTFLTACSTPYVAMGAELSDDYHERTMITGIRTVFFLMGFLISTVFGMAFFFRETAGFQQGQLNPDAYRKIGLATSCLIVACSTVTLLSTKKYIASLPQENYGQQQYQLGVRHLMDRLKIAMNNRPFRCIATGYLLTNIASAFASTLGLHVFTYTFGMDNTAIAWVFGTLFVCSMLSQPAWIAITRRIDKRPAVILGTSLATAGSLLLLLLVFFRGFVMQNPWAMLPFSILTGFGIGGFSSIPASMVADTIDYEESKTGIRSEGVFYGAITLVYKLSQAVAILLIGILIDLIRFDAELAVQTDSTLLLGLLLASGGIISFQLARLAYSRYSLNQFKLIEIRRQLTPKNQSSKIMDS